MLKVLLPKEERPLIPECDPILPNLSVGDMFLETVEDFYSLRNQTELFLLGLSNTSNPEACYSEDILQSLWRDFEKGLWKTNNGSRILIARIDSSKIESQRILKGMGLNGRDQPSLVACYENDCHYFVGSLESSWKMVVIHWLNRIQNPYVLLQSAEQIEDFLNQEKEWKEENDFFSEGFIPMGELYDKYSTKTRGVMIAETKESFANFDSIARKSVHRHELRLGLAHSKAVQYGIMQKYGKEQFRQERYGRECLLVKNRDNSTFSFVDEGRMLDQFNYIHKSSLLTIDVLDKHTAIVLTTLDIPMLASFLHPDIESLPEELKFHQDYYVKKTLPKLFEDFFNEYAFIGFDYTESQFQKTILGIDFDQFPTVAMIYKNGTYAVFPQIYAPTSKQATKWINMVQKQSEENPLMEIKNLRDIEEKIKYAIKPLKEVRAKAEEYQLIYGSYVNKKKGEKYDALSNSAYAVIAPFLPFEFEKKNIHQSFVGYIFSAYSVSVIICSLYIGKMITKIGRKTLIQYGVCLMGLSFILFAGLSYIENTTIYMGAMFAIRLLQGFASSTIQTTCYSIATNFYPEKKEALVGYLEAVCGVGLILGPLIGSILYSIGGFSFTFFSIGVVFIIISLFIQRLFPQNFDRNQQNLSILQELLANNLEDNHSKNVTIQIGYFSLLKYRRYTLAGCTATLGYFVYSYIEPTLAFRLSDFNLDQLQIGLFFTILPVFYITFSILVQFIPRGIEKRAVLIAACIFSFIVNLCIGPSQMFGFSDSLWIMAIGQILLGIANPILMIPTLPEMIESVIYDFPGQEEQVNDLSSGIFNFFNGLGAILGPIYGSLMTKQIGFRLTSDYLALFFLAFAFIYFLVGSGWSAFKDSRFTNYGEPVDFGYQLLSMPVVTRMRLFSNFSHSIHLNLKDTSYFSNTPQFREDSLNHPFISAHKRLFSTQHNFSFDKDYYKILAVSKQASNIEIRKSFFNLAKKYHPDLQHSKQSTIEYQRAQEIFKEVNEAYQILSNNELRKRYDMFIGIQEEPLNESIFTNQDSIYGQILKRREQKKNLQDQENEYINQKPFNLEEELQKLEQIKLQRQMHLNSKREEANRIRQEEINKLFFRKEFQNLQQQKLNKKDHSAYYKSKEEKKENVGNKTQQNFLNQFTTASIEAKDQFVKPNDNLQYFYSEYEKNPKMETLDNFMNLLFRIVSLGSVGLVLFLIYLHVSQKEKASNLAAKVTKQIERAGGQAYVQSDNTIAVYIDGQLMNIIDPSKNDDETSSEVLVNQKTNFFTISNKKIYGLLKSALKYMVEAQNNKKQLEDFYFYNQYMKSSLKKEITYDDVMKNWQLKEEPYGLSYRINKAGIQQLVRNTDSQLSIFENHCFIYYICKYCEILGLESLIASQEHISYTQKKKIVDYITRTECELGVQESSWKNCLLFLFYNGIRNEDVELSHIEIRDTNHKVEKNMIVMHGLLGNKLNWRGLCSREEICSRRNCYLVELRNHMSSNHHDEMNYNVISDDVIRFADKHHLNKFTVLGHSLGGRTAMTLACRYPDRVDGCISVDAAPIDERNDLKFREFTYNVLKFMNDLSNQDVSRDEALLKAREFFNNQLQFVALLERNMDPNHKDKVQWLVNAETLYKEYDNIPYFDESLRYNGPVYHIVGGRSKQYMFPQYQKIFPNITTEDIVVVQDAGHWVHFDKPLETVRLIAKFLDKIDAHHY